MLREDTRRPSLWTEGKLFCSGGCRKAELMAEVFLREKGIARGGQKRRSKRYRGNM
jgi:hypothetical protein